MKLRSTFLALALLLLIGHLASAGQISTQANPASASLTAIFSAPESPGCAEATLPSFEPAPVNKAVVCGTCSDTICQGKQFGAFCKVQDGRTYTCQPAYIVCTARDCECWTGPLP
ncbi:MAG TPA: hypothetical protein VLB76_25430 [Thermoanaerobaculia bacterium]|jgi:hypothetical protein|nr:hypothetical protein [Thermoanaerobaculia bacterium]